MGKSVYQLKATILETKPPVWRRVVVLEDTWPWGYASFLEAIADPDHEDHDRMLKRVGGAFDPDGFDPNEFHHRLNVGRLAAH